MQCDSTVHCWYLIALLNYGRVRWSTFDNGLNKRRGHAEQPDSQRDSRFMFSGKIAKSAAVGLCVLAVAACNGGTAGPSSEDFEQAVDRWWETAFPDFSANPDRPVISLVGNNVITLNVGDTFVDEGATAVDAQDGDLTAQISVINEVDTSVARDYLVRYSVTDSSQLDALEAVRIVRVVDGTPEKLTLRILGSTASHMGYVEHLPANYADDPNATYPLLIFNHGGGAMASTAGLRDATRAETLNAVVANGGPSLAVFLNNWDSMDRFVMLSPQTVSLGYDDPVGRLDAFIDYAELTYNVDPSRIYVSGWSAGAGLSLAHAVFHGDRVAALAPIAAGVRLTNATLFPSGFCDIEDVPVWAFHGDQDDTITVDVSIDNHNSLINTCVPPVTPKLTIYQNVGHFVHHDTYELRLLEGGSAGISGNPMYDLYDEPIFEWLLSHSLDDRGVP